MLATIAAFLQGKASPTIFPFLQTPFCSGTPRNGVSPCMRVRVPACSCAPVPKCRLLCCVLERRVPRHPQQKQPMRVGDWSLLIISKFTFDINMPRIRAKQIAAATGSQMYWISHSIADQTRGCAPPCLCACAVSFALAGLTSRFASTTRGLPARPR